MMMFGDFHFFIVSVIIYNGMNYEWRNSSVSAFFLLQHKLFR